MPYTTRNFNLKNDYQFVWDLHVKENMPYIERHMNVSIMETKEWFDNNIVRPGGFIVMSGDERIGCYFIYDEVDYFKLSRFFLLEAYQGQGIGRRLFNDVLSHIAGNSKPLMINVWEDNPVRDFWHKMGFAYISTDEDKLMTFKYAVPQTKTL
jgi:GNAT superfamily N-acetyltransferase